VLAEAQIWSSALQLKWSFSGESEDCGFTKDYFFIFRCFTNISIAIYKQQKVIANFPTIVSCYKPFFATSGNRLCVAAKVKPNAVALIKEKEPEKFVAVIVPLNTTGMYSKTMSFVSESSPYIVYGETNNTYILNFDTEEIVATLNQTWEFCSVLGDKILTDTKKLIDLSSGTVEDFKIGDKVTVSIGKNGWILSEGCLYSHDNKYIARIIGNSQGDTFWSSVCTENEFFLSSLENSPSMHCPCCCGDNQAQISCFSTEMPPKMLWQHRSKSPDEQLFKIVKVLPELGAVFVHNQKEFFVFGLYSGTILTKFQNPSNMDVRIRDVKVTSENELMVAYHQKETWKDFYVECYSLEFTKKESAKQKKKAAVKKTTPVPVNTFALLSLEKD
jgi:hypothetical protein